MWGGGGWGSLWPDRPSLPDLHGLPWFVNVSESQGPGARLWSFSFNCSSGTPSLKLLRVQPPSPFFNPPSLAPWQGLYVGQVGPGAAGKGEGQTCSHRARGGAGP